MIVISAAPMISCDARDVGRGGFPAWPLPSDATGARTARAVVRAVFDAVGMPAGLTQDTTVAISELATNVYAHALGGTAPAVRSPVGRPELWAYLRWGPRPEVVLKVFDSAPWSGPIAQGALRPPATAECGRGFEVVSALTAECGGRWGIHRTRSRLGGYPAPGKVVFVTVPIPPGCPAGALRPVPKPVRQVAEEVYALLAARGVGRMQGSAGHDMAVICVRAGVHVWILGESISYRLPERAAVRHALSDGVEVVEQIVRHCEDLDAAGSAADGSTADGREALAASPDP